MTDVRRDPDLTDEQVSSFVRRDYEAMFGQPMGSGPDKAATEAPSSAATLVWVAAGVGVAVIAGGVVLWVRRRHAAPRPRRAGVALRVAAFGETTGWAGKSILFEDERFVLEGCGVVSATDVMQFDKAIWSGPATACGPGSERRLRLSPRPLAKPPSRAAWRDALPVANPFGFGVSARLSPSSSVFY